MPFNSQFVPGGGCSITEHLIVFRQERLRPLDIIRLGGSVSSSHSFHFNRRAPQRKQNDMSNQAEPAFLTGSGQMRELIRSHNWAATPLGPLETWPEPLRIVVDLMLASHQAMFTIWGPEGTLLYNDRYIEILGNKHPGALGRPFLEVWSEIADEGKPLMDRAYAGESKHLEDMQYTLNRHGYPEETHFIVSYTPVRDETGQIAGVFCPCTETTDRVLVERSLRESDERFRLVCLATRDLVYDWNLDTNRLDWSDALVSQLGYLPDVFGATIDNWYDALHPDDRERVKSSMQAVIEGKGCYWSAEYRFRKNDGSYAMILDRGYFVRDESGRARRMIGSMLDLTKQKRTEQKLQKARDELEQRVRERTLELQHRADQLARLTSQLTLAEQRERRQLAQILHDHLQQLLVGVKLRLDSLSQQIPEDHQGLLQETEALLTESIAASRSLAVELSPPILFEVGLVAGLEWLARFMKEKHGLDVVLTSKHGVTVDREDVRFLLFVAVRELLFNVVKHAGVPQAFVHVASLGDEQVQIVVEDHGVGFTPQSLALDQDASGFGLFNIQERLQFLGGQFEIDSAPGRGARFTLIAPIKTERAIPPLPHRELVGDGAARQRERESEAEAVAGKEKIRVLIVDDHAVMRQGLSALLARQDGIEVVGEAADGVEAIEQARRLRPDVILMDFSMPNMDGVQATRLIHAEFPQIRIIGLSMYAEEDRAQAMLDAGAAAYHSKTGESRDLLAEIRQAGN
jgi:PAS domain S-box-containing protein